VRTPSTSSAGAASALGAAAPAPTMPSVADLGDAVDGATARGRGLVELARIDGDDLFDVVDDDAGHVVARLDDDDLGLRDVGVLDAEARREVVDREDLAAQGDHAAHARIRRGDRPRLGEPDDLVHLGDGQRVLLVAEREHDQLAGEGLFGHANSGLEGLAR
jgi:hypothetical protein